MSAWSEGSRQKKGTVEFSRTNIVTVAEFHLALAYRVQWFDNSSRGFDLTFGLRTSLVYVQCGMVPYPGTPRRHQVPRRGSDLFPKNA